MTPPLPPTPPAQPTRLQITTTTLPPGTAGQSYSATLQATGGTAPYTWSLGTGTLPTGLTLSTRSSNGVIAGTPTQGGSCNFAVQVQDAGSQTASASFTMTINSGLAIVTTAFWPAVVGVQYAASLSANGGTPPYSWSVNAPGLPSGLHLDASGQISGIAATTGTFPVTFVTRDSSNPPLSTRADLSMVLVPRAPLRNDTLQDSAVLPMITSPVAFIASFSPYSSSQGVATPDVDYYQFSALGGTVLVAEAGTPNQSTSPADPVIEILNSVGQRFATCRDLADDNPVGIPITPDPTPNAFDDACINDDKILGQTTDAYLEFQVPGAPDVITIFYVRVFDWHGNSRPDLIYQFSIRPR
ncbi:MAG: putative Ig domain-containing protein [Acidobacteria bacterium]|nr:putative Ig domain-containing protein [Acidobacteriota bacterium]